MGSLFQRVHHFHHEGDSTSWTDEARRRRRQTAPILLHSASRSERRSLLNSAAPHPTKNHEHPANSLRKKTSLIVSFCAECGWSEKKKRCMTVKQKRLFTPLTRSYAKREGEGNVKDILPQKQHFIHTEDPPK